MMPKYTKWLVDGVLIDTGSYIIFFVGRSLLPAVQIVNMSDVRQDMKSNEKRLDSVGKSVETLGTMNIFLHFGGREYLVTWNIIPGSTPLTILRKD